MSSCFTGQIINDTIGLEANESFDIYITHIAPENPSVVFGTDVTRINIIDDNCKLHNYRLHNCYRSSKYIASCGILMRLHLASVFFLYPYILYF